MSLLIDGYNLLNAVGIAGRGAGPGGLERSRLALLNFLAESLSAEEIPRTTVVFDARSAPPGLPGTTDHRGLTVRFAAGYEDADSLIEELIRSDSAPRKLVVVSSDHRLQRAARRRRATPIDSDAWYAEVLQRRRQRQQQSAVEGKNRPPLPPLAEDVDYWVRQFGGQGQQPPITDNPFPPGYAEDLE
jgi:hypothetical protein